ncbi:MAG: hypothetical protein LBB92_01135, partial [Endomicrobium sp.]|nr:hypothetical protein [Endomicrobium sp.]
LSEKPVKTKEGLEVVPLKVVKACLPDPKTLAPDYVGNTCKNIFYKFLLFYCPIINIMLSTFNFLYIINSKVNY